MGWGGPFPFQFRALFLIRASALVGLGGLYLPDFLLLPLLPPPPFSGCSGFHRAHPGNPSPAQRTSSLARCCVMEHVHGVWPWDVGILGEPSS